MFQRYVFWTLLKKYVFCLSWTSLLRPQFKLNQIDVSNVVRVMLFYRTVISKRSEKSNQYGCSKGISLWSI